MEVAARFDIQSLHTVKVIFRLREWRMGTSPSAPRKPPVTAAAFGQERTLGYYCHCAQ